MSMTDEQRKRLELAVERLAYKAVQVRKEHPEIQLGETAAPTPSGKVDDDPLRGPVNMEWPKLIEPEKKAVAAIVDEILAEMPKADTSRYTKLGEDNL